MSQTQLSPAAHNSGDKVAYALTVFNRGSDIANAIKLETIWPQTVFTLDSASEPYQAPLYTFTKTSLTPGQSWTVIITGSLKANIPVNTSFTNNISANLSGMEYATGNNASTLN